MNWLRDQFRWLWDEFLGIIRLVSVQVTLGWGLIWGYFGSLPPNVILEFTQKLVWGISIVTWMGMINTLMVVIARRWPQKPPQ